MFSYGRLYIDAQWLDDQLQLRTDTGCSLEDQPKAMDDRDGWREREREFGKSMLAAGHDGDAYNDNQSKGKNTLNSNQLKPVLKLMLCRTLLRAELLGKEI